jgi:hypothetical protein
VRLRVVENLYDVSSADEAGGALGQGRRSRVLVVVVAVVSFSMGQPHSCTEELLYLQYLTSHLRHTPRIRLAGESRVYYSTLP